MIAYLWIVLFDFAQPELKISLGLCQEMGSEYKAFSSGVCLFLKRKWILQKFFLRESEFC